MEIMMKLYSEREAKRHVEKEARHVDKKKQTNNTQMSQTLSGALRPPRAAAATARAAADDDGADVDVDVDVDCVVDGVVALDAGCSDAMVPPFICPKQNCDIVCNAMQQ